MISAIPVGGLRPLTLCALEEHSGAYKASTHINNVPARTTDFSQQSPKHVGSMAHGYMFAVLHSLWYCVFMSALIVLYVQ